MAAHVPQRAGLVGLITGLFLIKKPASAGFFYLRAPGTYSARKAPPSIAGCAIAGCTEAALRFKLNLTQ